MGLTRVVAALSFVWGMAEATLLFIVPDVGLTWIALDRGVRPAVKASLIVTAGALIGGSLMYTFGLHHPGEALVVLQRVPAISTGMLDGVRAGLEDHGAWAMVPGSVTGVPYKTFAAIAPSVGIGWSSFLAVSVPARMLRFLAAILIAWGVRRALPEGTERRTKARLHLGAWTLFYVVYLSLMPG